MMNPNVLETIKLRSETKKAEMALRTSFSERTGKSLTPSQILILNVIYDHDGTVTSDTLASQMNCTLSNLTGILDSLEEDGLVVRNRLPSDRRKVSVSMTDDGMALMEAYNTASAS